MSRFSDYLALVLALAIGYLLIWGVPEPAEPPVSDNTVAIEDLPTDELPLILVASGGDAAAGEDFYRRRCMACHSIEPKDHRVGPSMFGVIGRPAGQMADYSYSDAMRAAGFTWTADTLAQYLRDPRQFMPGTSMAYVGVRDAADLANVIAYLETLSVR